MWDSPRAGKALRRLPAALPLLCALALLTARLLGFQCLVVRGGSMHPALHHGDLLLVKCCLAPELDRGDIVTWRQGASTAITHRIVAKGGGTFRTKGDANGSGDTTARSANDAVGRVVCVVPRIGLLPVLLRTPVGFAGGVLVPAAILFASQVQVLLGGRLGARRTASTGDEGLDRGGDGL